jgi:hypothetical protein
MQVVCSSCQLSFQAPEGATGLVCPICRSPLRADQASGEAAGATANVHEWAGGTLDDLMSFLNPPALSVRIEVLPAKSDLVAGEVHLLAGGVSEAIFAGRSTDDALEKLRAVSPVRFRIEPRLPNPNDGDLTYPGPDAGTLDARPLAHLMRYCEQYVITCGIEVWRGNENARVEYRKGEISGVTVGGIDAPERLAEVMQWASGNYRLTVPRLTLPDTIVRKPVAPATTRTTGATAAAPAPVAVPSKPPASAPVPLPAAAMPSAPAPSPSPSPAAPAAMSAASAQSTRTIFGMPALDAAALKAAETAAEASGKAAAPAIVAPPIGPGVAPVPVPVPAPLAAANDRANDRQSATKTIFGVPAPRMPEQQAAKPAARAAAPAPVPVETATQKADRKTGARKTLVPAPEIIPPPAESGPVVAAPVPAPAAAPAVASSAVSRTTQDGYGPVEAALVRPAAPIEDRTQPVRVGANSAARTTPVWTYVGVGFLFGLALLGIYQLVGVLAH